MKVSDLLILIGILAAGAALALLLGGGIVSQAVMALAVGGGGAFIGTRIKNRREASK
ncbi:MULTISPECIES: hypothetical protein [unclassified Streptomyces]|uniref:hypothetical protein n=1 Tax=unclassified Streptomyces TaxID=2593676 RepID=UPI0022514523|nr:MULTISPECIES: hypothetical protein [unclassified Streptomyces]WSP56894.1 hypothetical protein OG306_22870 [Streptomyces sp. NBC_01241]WSU22389.1 hypothetical protein OG508_16355 [Streptomyces sp. NBC_01108]MCX4788676.1 hypothetical protein [Streptomyces sp. NBC_01221]MCX4795576.1 hypothetical protein [Streptomyces sp. NBC_01242]WSJ36861.1 hypothetical protein OG772_12970 [Streptomyces sp. NBC_01321]